MGRGGGGGGGGGLTIVDDDDGDGGSSGGVEGETEDSLPVQRAEIDRINSGSELVSAKREPPSGANTFWSA